jgi:integrase
MASVTKRPNGRWQARWRLTPNGKQFSKLFDRKLDAERHISKVVTDLDRGAYVDPRVGRETVGSYSKRWMTAQVWRDSSRDRIESIFEKHVIPVLGDQAIASVQRSEVQAWVARLAQTLASSTVRNYAHVLGMMFNAAVLDGVIARSPMIKLNLPRDGSNKSALVPLSTGEVHDIARRFPPSYRNAVLAQAGLGLRQAELRGLTVDRVDFLRSTVRIDRQLISITDGVPTFGPPKTPASNRVMPLPSSVRDLLADHLRRYPVGEYGLVFTNTEGRPIGPSTYAARFRKATEAVGVDASSQDLRHYCASMLIASGCSVKAVQRFLGHASAVETLDTYGHLWPDDEDRIRAAIDAVLAPAEESLRNQRTREIR